MPYRTKPPGFIPEPVEHSTPETKKLLPYPERRTKTKTVECLMCKSSYDVVEEELSKEDLFFINSPHLMGHRHPARSIPIRKGFCTYLCEKSWNDEERRNKQILSDLDFFQKSFDAGLVGPTSVSYSSLSQYSVVSLFYGHDVTKLLSRCPINLAPFLLSLVLHSNSPDLIEDQSFENYFKTNYPMKLEVKDFYSNFNVLETKTIFYMVKRL